ncbi:MAG: PIN domain-containing protein [Candidatus Thorarchaeota archaeon]
MTIFIDSNIIIALLNSRDRNHSRAKELLNELKEPKFGMRFTNDYVLDEVVTTLWMHTHRKSMVNKAYKPQLPWFLILLGKSGSCLQMA